MPIGGGGGADIVTVVVTKVAIGPRREYEGKAAKFSAAGGLLAPADYASGKVYKFYNRREKVSSSYDPFLEVDQEVDIIKRNKIWVTLEIPDGFPTV